MKKIQNFFSTILQKLWKSSIKAKENMEGGNNMKKRATIVLGLVLILTLVGCGNNAQSSDAHNAEYEEGYAAGYEAGYNDGRTANDRKPKAFCTVFGFFYGYC